ncbi:MAG: FkbM family methyltransferase [Actinomycetota bacterium]|nr:FkbM family methyltransferase [Actinomycetota bacterium]
MSGPGSRRAGARRDRTGRLLASLPGFAQEVLRLAYVAVRVAQGPRSFLTYLRLKRIPRHTGSGGTVVRMRLRPLGGHAALLRPSTSDVDTLWGTFAGLYHRPPEEMDPAGLRLIWDLGSNIGLTMADLARRHPGARVIGVELDPENAALARTNTAPWTDRCEVVEAAVWPEDGQLHYVRLPGATSGHYVTEAELDEDPAVSLAHSISPASLLALSGPGSIVDYVKVDIEGAESRLLRERTAWAQRVRAIKVEVHGAYTVEDCRSDLEQLAFETRLDPRQAACVIGTRRT